MKRRKNSTDLETLVRAGVQDALLARLRIQAEHEGDLLGRELLLDQDFRREFVELAREIAQEALADLRARR